MLPTQSITIEDLDECTVPQRQGSAPSSNSAVPGSVLIVNADDWGRDRKTTECTLDCILEGTVSSVSAMVFMQDSQRAASVARKHDIDAGLHLNLTTPFTSPECPAPLKEHQRKVARFLRSSRFAPAIYHPGLAGSFRYVVQAQIDEYQRLYGCPPRRVDGHHHMHLAANVVAQKLLPAGTIVRRNFSFFPGEKSLANRIYRSRQDSLLARRHRLTDFFFDILPLDTQRLARIAALGRGHSIEIETHPTDVRQYEFLMRGGLSAISTRTEIARGFELHSPGFLMTKKPETGRNAVLESRSAAMPHICICICTYKRPLPLRRLLECLAEQQTGSLFSYSIVVADNDDARAAEAVVREAHQRLPLRIVYCVESARGIARARNQAVAHAEGDFIAMIDDDEFPAPDWLLNLFTTFQKYDVAGVLGPVRRHFDEAPPAWLKKSRLYDRRVNPTGMRVDWQEARTGNVLLKRSLLTSEPMPFRPEFKCGEDRDFFRRRIEDGHAFVWSADAEVFEVLPPARWTRSYYVRKALLQGAYFALRPDCDAVSILKSMVAVPVYTAALPFALLAGQQHFMTVLVKLCDHAGKLLFKMNINPIREEYVSD